LGYSGAVALLLCAAPVRAVHDDGIFQLDGDALQATCGTAFGGGLSCTGDDWDDDYTCTAGGGQGCAEATPGTGNGADAIGEYVLDPAPASIFTGGGSKDEKDLTAWRWKDGSVPDKDDLVGAFSALYDGDVIYFGANRLAVNGDAQIGFWFFQTQVSLKSNGTFVDANGNPAHHQVGDLLVLSNFTQGGGTANIQVYQVTLVGPASGQAVSCPAGSVETSAGAGDVCVKLIEQGTAGANGVCNAAAGGVPADSACAATNGEVIASLDPDFVPKAGANAGQYPIVGFFEGGVDLGALGLSGLCFPVFLAETRSSQSITAVLKDFTLGQFENCEAAIRTEIHSAANNSDSDLQGLAVEPGTTVHDLAIVTGTAGAPKPTGSVTFTLYNGKTCSGSVIATYANVAVAAGGAGCPTDAVCANSSAYTPSNPGGISYSATYNGDIRYDPITSLCEPLTINEFSSAVNTHIFTSALSCSGGTAPCELTDNHLDLAGAASVGVRDQVVVTRNPAGGASDPVPTGTVTFTRYQFSNCTGTSSSETVTLGACPAGFPAAPAGGATGCSSVFQLGPNTLGYKAVYNGDDNYLASTSSRCEPVCAIDTTK